MGSEVDVAFLDKYTNMRSSLSGGIALFPTFLGQSQNKFEYSLQISHLAMEKKEEKIVLLLFSA